MLFSLKGPLPCPAACDLLLASGCVGLTGVPVFLANMVFSAWIKFVAYPPAIILMACILALGLLYLAFVHARWVHHVGGSSPALRVDKQVGARLPLWLRVHS